MNELNEWKHTLSSRNGIFQAMIGHPQNAVILKMLFRNIHLTDESCSNAGENVSGLQSKMQHCMLSQSTFVSCLRDDKGKWIRQDRGAGKSQGHDLHSNISVPLGDASYHAGVTFLCVGRNFTRRKWKQNCSRLDISSSVN